ncbi:MAG: glycosyltransferase family 2 protein [Taibaiella sp.]|nr:glycosyltransferase family 2 protein [Taibaiella sp.]
MGKAEEHIRFSVVIPVYNGVKTIERTLDSVLNQTYSAHEIIVVDDASTDETCTLIERHYVGKVNLIKTKVNAGSSAARNAGMEKATGDYIAFLDADDIWHTDKLRIMNELLAANPDIYLLYHTYTLENVEDIVVPQPFTSSVVPFYRMLPGNLISTSCAVVRNNKTFRFESSMRYTEDYDLWLRIAYRQKMYFADLALTQLLRGITTAGGISADKWKMRKGELLAYTRLIKLNLFFVFLVPFLWGYSLLKHVYKMLK